MNPLFQPSLFSTWHEPLDSGRFSHAPDYKTSQRVCAQSTCARTTSARIKAQHLHQGTDRDNDH
jgi:hypothetical protein